MLIRASVTNFKSFNEETEFNMLASSDQRSHKEHVYTQHGVDLLKTAAIYGANGAGKSNLVKAVAALQKIVIEGGEKSLDELVGFKLIHNGNPTIIEIEFVKDDIVYLYGLSVHERTIIEEWLYESGLGISDDKVLFHREQKHENIELKFSDKYINTDEGKFRLKFYQDELLKNDIILFKELASLKEGYDEIKKAYKWFLNNLVLIFPNTKYKAIVGKMFNSEQFKMFANNSICSFHTGIDQLEIASMQLADFLGKDKQELYDRVLKDLKGDKKLVPLVYKNRWGSRDEVIVIMEDDLPVVKQLLLKHKNSNDELVDFRSDEESDGTIRLLDFVPAIYSAIYFDVTIIIDEIDQSIHPGLLKELVHKFAADPTTKGQLIFTTHESNLLDQAIFRRDEIWFAEKHEGATKLYPLSDFDIRLDLDIRKGYLNGRFGAIPFLGNLADLNWDQYAEA